MMKNLAISSLVAISGCFALIGCTQASAVSENDFKKPMAMQHYDKEGKRGQHGHYHHHARGHRGANMGVDRGPLARLNLSDTQKTQIEAINKAHAEQRQQNKALSKEQRKQLTQQHRAAIESVLTPAQKQQMQEMRQAHHSKWRQRDGQKQEQDNR